MGRVSQAQAEENRRRVVDTASRLFREQGTHVSVADLMKAAGLTHGAFYKQFASKEALVDEATAHAFAELAQRYSDGLERYEGQRDAAQQALIDAYLSVEHRDDPADGCPVAALATDIAREGGGSEARRVYSRGGGRLRRFPRHRRPGRHRPPLHPVRRAGPVPGHQRLPALRRDPRRRTHGTDRHQLTAETVQGGTPQEGRASLHPVVPSTSRERLSRVASHRRTPDLPDGLRA